MYCHEVTSPQAFEGLRNRGLKVFRPQQVTCMPDHNIPTVNQELPIQDPVSKNQVDTLDRNARDFGVNYYPMGHPKNGVIHIVGPENGLSLPGMTMVCGDSHTSTHGASYRLWYRHFRSGNGAGYTMRVPIPSQNNAYQF